MLLGLLRRSTDGRARAGRGVVLAATDLGHEFGPRATLVQFSTVVCQPCRATERVLGGIAESRGPLG